MKLYEFPFDLQLFAESDSSTTTATLPNTTATMSNEMKTFYEKRLIDQAEPRLVHDQFADYYPIPMGGGKTIEFRKYDSLPKAMTPLEEGVTPDGQALNVSVVKSDLHQYGGWTPLTDVLQPSTPSPATCWPAAPTSSMRPRWAATAPRPPSPAARAST